MSKNAPLPVAPAKNIEKVCVLFRNLPSSLVKTMNTTIENDEVRRKVQERYAAVAQNTERGCGTGCCSGVLESGTDAEKLGYAGEDVASVPEGSDMGLGCGNPTALASIKAGETIIDLGSGGGFDAFLCSRKTGPSGKVIGVDMTAEMVSKARKNAASGGYTNVDFRLGEIENLPVADGTADLIISNCVINLSPDKSRVFAEAFRVLKPGGRIAISDIVALQPIPDSVRQDFAAYTGCVAGAATVHEVESLLAGAGFARILVEVKQASRQFINDWLPGHRAGDYVASANITANKP